MVRPHLIEEARRHQRRRRGITGAILLVPLAIGGLVVGLSLGGANEQGKTVGTSASDAPQLHDVQAQNQKSPSTTETLSPSTAASVQASVRAAALQAAQKAVDDQAAKIRSSQLPHMAPPQGASQVAAAAAQEAAAAAATQPGHR